MWRLDSREAFGHFIHSSCNQELFCFIGDMLSIYNASVYLYYYSILLWFKPPPSEATHSFLSCKFPFVSLCLFLHTQKVTWCLLTCKSKGAGCCRTTGIPQNYYEYDLLLCARAHRPVHTPKRPAWAAHTAIIFYSVYRTCEGLIRWFTGSSGLRVFSILLLY